MNRIEVGLRVVDASFEIIRELEPTGFPLTDPGEDVQAVHGWKRHVAQRLGSAVTAIVEAELAREDVTATPLIPRAELEETAAILLGPTEDGDDEATADDDGGADAGGAPEASGEDDAGSEGATSDGEGGGAVSRPRTRRSRSGEAPTA